MPEIEHLLLRVDQYLVSIVCHPHITVGSNGYLVSACSLSSSQFVDQVVVLVCDDKFRWVTKSPTNLLPALSMKRPAVPVLDGGV